MESTRGDGITLDPYGPAICRHCGQPRFDTGAKDRCPGPSIEEMHAALDRNLRIYTFISEIPRKVV